jgi:hypothetical protein
MTSDACGNGTLRKRLRKARTSSEDGVTQTSVTTPMVAAILAMACAGLGCRNSSAEGHREDAMPTQAIPVSALTPSPPRRPIPQPPAVSVASFAQPGGLLEECDDFALEWPIELDVGSASLAPGEAGVVAAEAILEFALRTRPGTTRVGRSCVIQFPWASNPILATCTTSWGAFDAGEAGVHPLGETRRYYDPAAIDGQLTADCLERDGEWHALPKDSRAFQDALRIRSQGAGHEVP